MSPLITLTTQQTARSPSNATSDTGLENPPRSQITFDDQEVLQAKAPVACPTLDSRVSLWYGGDHPPILGVRRVAVITSKGGPAVETDYAVTPNPTVPGCVSNPMVGTTLLTGEQAGTDDQPGYDCRCDQPPQQ